MTVADRAGPADPPAERRVVLEVEDLVKQYPLSGHGARRGKITAADGVSLRLREGETIALVGESGSGKSTVANLLAKLQRPTSGTIRLDGEPTANFGPRLRRYRRDVQIVFQDPFGSLNPQHTVGHHLARPLAIHGTADRAQRRDAVRELLAQVNLTPPDQIAAKRPHELSGGQRQRVAIARAIAPDPRVLLADEPVSMLDVSIRLEILNLIDRLKAQRNLAVLYITHDLATARHFSVETLVMYRGEVVERGRTDDVILRPAHPYTQLLAEAAPDPARREERRARGLGVRPVRIVANPSVGCPFAPRCPHAMERCVAERPPLLTAPSGQQAKCWLYDPSVGSSAPLPADAPRVA